MDNNKKWSTVLSEWERIGLSQAEYCRQKGILGTRLSYWKMKLSKAGHKPSPKEPEFISIIPEVKLGSIEIAYGTVKITLPDGIESKKVAELIKCLN
jgi:hypothetical protein